jgi:hypothetical protein
MNLKNILNLINCIASIIAAALWFKSTLVIIKPSNIPPNEDGYYQETLTVEHVKYGSYEPFETAIKQSEWNKWAALAASIAALSQALNILLPD